MADVLPIKLVNNTNYFCPAKTKVNLSVANPASFKFNLNKQEGYKSRLYYEFDYCEKHDGQTFFFTFTYNDAHIPSYEGIPCFDYKDLTNLLNGGLKQKLKRDFGTKFKYFVGAELGDGKGKRGLENNPHYHILFFLRPDDGKDALPYKKISRLEFRSLCRKYWQGFDQDVDGYHDFRTYGKGIVKEGKFDLGQVTDFRAINYVSKYVTKDTILQKREVDLMKLLFKRYFDQLYKEDFVRNNFFVAEVLPRFGVKFDDLPTKEDWFFYIADTIRYIAPRVFDIAGITSNNYLDFFDSIIKEACLVSDFNDFVSVQAQSLVDDDIRIYRNRYCNKCRISQGVGISAIDDMDYDNPSVKIPSKDGFVTKPINLYYYRKLFYDVRKDAVGNNIYVLNKKGIEMKVRSLPSAIDSLAAKCDSYLKILNKDLFDKVVSSDLNHNFDYDFEYLESSGVLYNPNISKLYATYKLVYEGRYFRPNSITADSISSEPRLDTMADYLFFITPSFGEVDYHCGASRSFFENDCEGYISFSSHPVFYPYMRFFALFDLLFDYFFVNKDTCFRQKSDEIRKVKKFHDKLQLHTYFTNLIF